MANSRGSKPMLRPWQWGMVLFVLPVLTIVLVTKALRESGIIGIEGSGVSFFAMGVVASVCGILHWRGLDEPSREGHKFASTWGAGVAFLFVLLIGFEMQFFSGLRDITQGWVEGWIAISSGKYGEQQGAVGFYLGMIASSALLGLGYALVWIGWWARQRMGTTSQ